MSVLKIELKGYTASFRKPQNMKIQDSLPFPPPTTLVGLFGAAMGLSHDQALKKFEKSLMGIKVYGSVAEGYDLWKIKKTDKSRRKTFKSLVKRQFHYLPRYCIYIIDTEQLLHKLELALKMPVYPLCLGRNDELVTSVNSEFVLGKFTEEGEIDNVVVKGTLNPEDITPMNLTNQTIKKFNVFRITKNFQTNLQKGYRVPTGYDEYTFVGTKIRYSGNLLQTEKENIPLWRWAT